MERLTELKVGQKFDVQVLINWAKKNFNRYGVCNWSEGSSNVFSEKHKYRYIEAIGVTSQANSFTVATEGCSSVILKSEGFIEFYNEFYKLDTQPVAKERPTMDYSNLSQVEFQLPNKETQDKLLTRLFELGYKLNDKKRLWDKYLNYWRINTDKHISGGTASKGFTLIDYELIINKNNTPLNTAVNGNKIIVCKPAKTITGGQRPEGTSISGKTRSTTIGVGHLSHRAINS